MNRSKKNEDNEKTTRGKSRTTLLRRELCTNNVVSKMQIERKKKKIFYNRDAIF